MRKLLLTLTAGMVFIILTSALAFAANGYKDIDAAGTKSLMENAEALVVFPLSPIEFDNQHIQGSVNIVMDMLEYELPEDKERVIVFYCLGIKCVASWRAAAGGMLYRMNMRPRSSRVWFPVCNIHPGACPTGSILRWE